MARNQARNQAMERETNKQDQDQVKSPIAQK